MNNEIKRLARLVVPNFHKYNAQSQINLYEEKIIVLFNEYLNDNNDSFKFGDQELCADEVLYNHMPVQYLNELKAFIQYLQDHEGLNIDDYGHSMNSIQEEEI